VTLRWWLSVSPRAWQTVQLNTVKLFAVVWQSMHGRLWGPFNGNAVWENRPCVHDVSVA
jgi:hypothetical protein